MSSTHTSPADDAALEALLAAYQSCNAEGRRKIMEYADWIKTRGEYAAGSVRVGSGYMIPVNGGRRE